MSSCFEDRHQLSAKGDLSSLGWSQHFDAEARTTAWAAKWDANVKESRDAVDEVASIVAVVDGP